MSRCRSFCGPVDAGGANDESQPFGRFQFTKPLSERPAGLVVLDLAADADALQSGHEHEVPAGNADVGRERRALGADPLFDDLHEHFGAALKDLLNRRFVACGTLVEAFALGPFGAGRVLDLLAIRLAQQMLVILVLDVGNVQKAVPTHAEIDEHRLNTGLDVNHLALVDVSDVVFLARPFNIQLFENAVLDDGDAALLRLKDVDQHLFFHGAPFVCGDERCAPRRRRMSRSGRATGTIAAETSAAIFPAARRMYPPDRPSPDRRV